MTKMIFITRGEGGFAPMGFAGSSMNVMESAPAPTGIRKLTRRIRGARFTAGVLFELSRWWLLDVCQVMLILAIITFADQEMGLTSQHIFTTLSRIAAILYVTGSFRQLVRRFQADLNLQDRVTILGVRISMVDSLSVAALVSVALALTIYLDGIVFAFGGMVR